MGNHGVEERVGNLDTIAFQHRIVELGILRNLFDCLIFEYRTQHIDYLTSLDLIGRDWDIPCFVIVDGEAYAHQFSIHHIDRCFGVESEVRNPEKLRYEILNLLSSVAKLVVGLYR